MVNKKYPIPNEIKMYNHSIYDFRRSQAESDSSAETGDKVEAELVVQALRLNTLSKLTFGDSSR